MECPVCTHDNIEGVDECVRCQTDLSDVLAAVPQSGIEHELLTTQLGDLATQSYLEVPPDRTVGDTLKHWVDAGHQCVIVTKSAAVAGILTERDVLNKLFADPVVGQVDEDLEGLVQGSREMLVGELMTPNPVTLDADVPVGFGLNRMMIGGYRHIPIECEGRLVGVVSVRDVLAYLTSRFDDAAGSGAIA